jgi:hypothetical protein
MQKHTLHRFPSFGHCRRRTRSPSRRPVAAPLRREQSEVARISLPRQATARRDSPRFFFYFLGRQLGLVGGWPPRSRLILLGILLGESFDSWSVVVGSDLTDAGVGIWATKLRHHGDAEAGEAP